MSHLRPCHECHQPCIGRWLSPAGDPLCSRCAQAWPSTRAPDAAPPPPKPGKLLPVHQIPLAPVEPRVGRRAWREGLRAELREILEKYSGAKRGVRG